MLLKGDLETYKKGSWRPLTGASVDKYFPVASNVTHIRFKGFDMMIDEFRRDEVIVYADKEQK
jgi:hypothetical protein